MNIKMLLGTVVVSTDLSVEDMLHAKRAYPEALALTDEEGNEIFRVCMEERCDPISAYGVSFNAVDTNGNCAIKFDLLNGMTKQEVAEFLVPVWTKLEPVIANIKEAASAYNETVTGLAAIIEEV